MAIMITPSQLLAFEAAQLRQFAGEVVRTLVPIVERRQAVPPQHASDEFALAQIRQAERLGLKRRNEMMAWALCALVHGPGFEQRIPQVRGIVAERNYDRSMLLTMLALHGLGEPGRGA